MWFNKKKWKASRFPRFRFCLIPKIENSGILEFSLLLQFLVAYEAKVQKQKSPKPKKTNCMMWFNKNEQKLTRFQSFQFDLITKAENSGIRNVFFSSIFDIGTFNSYVRLLRGRGNVLIYETFGKNGGEGDINYAFT